jgi:3-hydroxyisobutyrate dehydrogenase-like beta-hydroxyacid dehydrogenase
MTDTVGFIGLGTMGRPMAAKLARAGVPLVVHDIDPAAARAAAEATGARIVHSPAEVAARSAVLFTCLPTDDIVRACYLGPRGVVEGGNRGLVSCDCSTVSPEVTVEVHQALAARGMTHLDTPMLGSQPQAVAGEIFFIVGGDASAVETVAPYLAIMGKRHLHVGPSGTGNRIKLLHNGLAAVMAVAVAEALAACVQAGVDPYVFYDVVRQGGGMAYSTYFERRARRILDGDFTPTFMAELMLKDVRLALELARRAKVPTPLLEEATRTYEEAVAAGWGREDFSAVTHVIERRIGRRLGRTDAGPGG